MLHHPRFLILCQKEGDGDACREIIIGLRRWSLSLLILVPTSERELVLCFRESLYKIRFCVTHLRFRDDHLWVVSCMLFSSLSAAFGCNSTSEQEFLPVAPRRGCRGSSLPRSKQDRFGTRFHDASSEYRSTPKLTETELPNVPYANALRGQTRRDDLGNV